MVVAVLIAVVVAAGAAVAALLSHIGRERRRADGLATELAAARAEEAAASARADEAERASEEARREHDAALGRLGAADSLVHSLWSLELLRVAREWAVTGMAAPGDGPVAVDTGAELVMALRMELDRQREETGIPGDLEPPETIGVVPVSSALATLRIVEEVLAVVSRASDGLTVTVGVVDGELEVTITLDAAAADVPPMLHDLASNAGGSITVDGSTVVVRLPA